MRDIAHITIATKYEFMYLYSNVVIVNVVHRDLDRLFQNTQFEKLYIWKNVRARENAEFRLL